MDREVIFVGLDHSINLEEVFCELVEFALLSVFTEQQQHRGASSSQPPIADSQGRRALGTGSQERVVGHAASGRPSGDDMW